MNGATVGFVLLADTFDDPENARIILLSAAGLVVIGLLIAAGTVWWWRSSEVEHPALGPLEVMGSRSWWKGDYTSRRRRLEAARPEGAEPVDPPTISMSEPVDLKAAASASPREFDDLLEFPPEAAAAQETEAEAEVGAPAEESVADEIGVDQESVAQVEVAQADVAQVDDLELDDQVVIDEHDDDLHDESLELAPDETSVADVPRPIDPLLRLQHDE